MGSYTQFKVDPKLASLLGDNYRSSELAIKELVDNSWDADSDNVSISLPEVNTSDPIIVFDNGSGMTSAEVENEYLWIANDRRSRKGERSLTKNRLVKGRKGIGKFAGLMSANLMEIVTFARGKKTTIKISKDDLVKSRNDLEKIKLPIFVEPCDIDEHGTKITLSSLNQNLLFPNPDRLRQILIMDYGRCTGFKISVNGIPISVQDIPGDKVNESAVLPKAGKVKLNVTFTDGIKNLKNAGIAIRVKGKIVGRPSFFGLEDDDEIPKKLLKKIYGEIEADGLNDCVTADWGAIIENCEAFVETSDWIKIHLKEKIEKHFSNEVQLQKARLQKQINERLKLLPEHRRYFAEKTLERIFKRLYGESLEKIEIITSVILDAFEKDEYWEILKTIDEAKQKDVAAFAEALGTFGILDMSLIATQAKRRLDFLNELEILISDETTLEKDVHKAFEHNLWLLGVEHSLMSSNETLKNVINHYTDRNYSGTRRNNRPDLFLSTNVLKKYLLIEFKRPSYILGRDDQAQAEKYRDDLTPEFGTMDIYIIGKSRSTKIDSRYDKEDIKYLSYRSILSNARAQLDWLISELRKS
jgi:hypothetical protein